VPLWIRRRRDPFWETNGPAARREHLRTRLMGMIALSYSVVAAAVTIAAWGIELGLAHVPGIRLFIID
jgi:hypothetical protein